MKPGDELVVTPVQKQKMLEARAELERRIVNERGRYYVPNGKAEQFINMLGHAKQDGITIFILRAGNSFGKTALATNIINYLCDNVSNKYLDKIEALQKFRKPGSRGRLCTTANAAKETYSVEFKKWFSRNQYKTTKMGREFDSKYEFTRTSCNFDVFTFDQDPEAGESITLDWAVIDEPMSKRHFSGLKRGLRFGGIIIFILTPLEGSGWYHDVFETPERLGKDVFVLEGSSEENCIEHGVRGVIPHAALEDTWRDYDEAELPARRDGKYLHLAGAIYKTYRDDHSGHVWEKFPDWYQECWQQQRFTLYRVVDPHDRKPFAIAWHAVFPNEHVVTVAEWPDESWRPFHKINSCNWSVPMYVKMILETEKLLGKKADVCLIDPNFGLAAKKGGASVLQEFEDNGLYGWDLPPDAIAAGHLAVKQLLGDPGKGIEPRWNILEHCKNMRYGLSHYGYKESRDASRGLSETPELVNKDFCDLGRYPANYGFRYIKQEAQDAEPVMPAALRQGNGYVGA